MKPAMLFLEMALWLATNAPALPVPEKEKVPDLAGRTQFGKLVQDGTRLTIDGNGAWSATGEIRADRSVYLLWITSSGQLAPAVYRLNENGNLVGHWGWINVVDLDNDGNLEGIISPETLYLTKE